MTATLQTRPRWTVQGFADFWAAPWVNPNLPAVMDEEIVGYWPFAPAPVRGRADYFACIKAVIEAVPDLRLEIGEALSEGDVHFIRWIARGTPPVGSHEWSGVDRLITRDGLVLENRVCSDHPVFARLFGPSA